jgi:hypothetical protein
VVEVRHTAFTREKWWVGGGEIRYRAVPSHSPIRLSGEAGLEVRSSVEKRKGEVKCIMYGSRVLTSKDMYCASITSINDFIQFNEAISRTVRVILK